MCCGLIVRGGIAYFAGGVLDGTDPVVLSDLPEELKLYTDNQLKAFSTGFVTALGLSSGGGLGSTGDNCPGPQILAIGNSTREHQAGGGDTLSIFLRGVPGQSPIGRSF